MKVICTLFSDLIDDMIFRAQDFILKLVLQRRGVDRREIEPIVNALPGCSFSEFESIFGSFHVYSEYDLLCYRRFVALTWHDA